MRPSQRRSILVGLSLGALVSAVFAIVIAASGGSGGVTRIDGPVTDTAPQPSTPAGKTVPTATFERFTGGTGSFDDYLGMPLVVNFWSTTCAPCVKEMPALQHVSQNDTGRVRFLGVDVNDTLADGKAFAAKVGASYDLARDPPGELVSAFGGSFLPMTVFVSAEGTVLETHSGALTAGELAGKIKANFG